MKKLIITTLLLSLMLSACNKKPAEDKTSTKKGNTVEVLTNQNTDEKKVTQAEDTDADKKKISNDEKDSAKNSDIKDTDIVSLIKNSDYISRIRITAAGSSTDVNFIEDYRGDLSNIVLDIPKGLKENREYILFYVDGKDGKIAPVSEDSAFIELSGSDDSRLKFLDKEFGVKSSPGIVDNTTAKDSKKSTTKATKPSDDSKLEKPSSKSTKDVKTTDKESLKATDENSKTTKETTATKDGSKTTKETKPTK